MLKFFNTKWNEVPIVVIDVETTGTIPGIDAAVQVALVRFEKGEPVARFCSHVNPGRSIPKVATDIHGITDADVEHSPPIEAVFSLPEVKRLITDANPAAYNASFDRAFVPLYAWGEDWGWPWIDPLTVVRNVDRFVRGAGRHKLEAACARRGITIAKAHDAAADAEAAGRLFYMIVPETDWARLGDYDPGILGQLLAWQRHEESSEWFRFSEWRAAQPPRPGVSP